MVIMKNLKRNLEKNFILRIIIILVVNQKIVILWKKIILKMEKVIIQIKVVVTVIVIIMIY